MDALYDKILAMKLVLRDTHTHFLPYSATDIKRLAATKRDGVALKQLYQLEEQIAGLRQAFRDIRLAPKDETPQ
jgi:hypothetical protein